MKRLLCALTAVIFLCFIFAAFADGFSDNPDQINMAAKSVMKLEVYKNGEMIKTGSGFVAFDNRHLITNYHVAKDADEIYAYSDAGDPYMIKNVCISDSSKDIAILQFFSPTDLEPLTLNESGEVQRASSVIAIGSPRGFSNSVSSGVVSSIYTDNGCSYIQFTAPISSGSSGGALFDDNGNVIGITSAAYKDGAGITQNLNLAVNIIEAIELYSHYTGELVKLRDLKQSDIWAPSPTPVPTITPSPKPASDSNDLRGKPRMGISVYTSEGQGGAFPRGVYIAEVETGSPADKGGLKAGDIIVEVNGQIISSVDEQVEILSQLKEGDKIAMVVFRPSIVTDAASGRISTDGDYIDLTVVLAMLDTEGK